MAGRKNIPCRTISSDCCLAVLHMASARCAASMRCRCPPGRQWCGSIRSMRSWPLVAVEPEALKGALHELAGGVQCTVLADHGGGQVNVAGHLDSTAKRFF